MAGPAARQPTAPAGQIPAAIPALFLALALALILILTLAASAPAQARTDGPTLPATLVADQVQIDTRGRLVAEGSVEVWHGATRLRARRIVYDPGSGGLAIEGPLVLQDGPDRLVLADAAQLSSDLREGLIESARIVLNGQLQIAAARTQRQGGQLTRMEAVVASTCEVCAANPTPLWEIRAASVTHDTERHRLAFERAQLRLRGVPVLYLPHLTVPDGTEPRVAGLLRPELRFSTEFGLQVALPWFIPLGPGRDLTLTPFLANRGMAGLALRWRQATARGGWDIGGQVSRDPLEPGRLRGYAYVRGLFALGHGFRLDVDVLLPGDRRYLETYGLTDAGRLRSHVTAERIRRDEAIRARAVVFRSLRPGEDNSVLPNQVLQADWERRWGDIPGLGGEATLASRLHAHQRRATTPGEAGRDVARAALSFGWQRREVLPGGVLVSLGLRGRLDHVRIGDDPGFAEPVTRHAAETTVELRWPWVGSDRAGGRQLIEPVARLTLARASAAVLPNEDHLLPELDAGNLFAPIRHSGLDAPDDGSRLETGLRWMRHDPAGWSAEGVVGRIFRRTPLTGFAPDHRQPLGAARSDWLLAGRLRSDQGLALGLRVLFDDNRTLSRGEAFASLQRQRGTSLSTRLLHVTANPAEARPVALNEWSLDLGHGFASGWRGSLGWDYDFGAREWSAARGGLVYRTDCMAVDVSLSRRFVTSTNLTPSTRFGLRFELLGLSGGRAGPSGRACGA